MFILGCFLGAKVDGQLALAFADQSWDFSVGTTVTTIFVAGWLLVAAGAAWVYFHRSVLKIDDHFSGHHPFQIRIHNKGLGEGETSLFVQRVTNNDGDDLDQTLPVEVSWEHNGLMRPRIVGGSSAVARVGSVTVAENNLFHLVVSRLNGVPYKISEGVEFGGVFWLKLVARDDYIAIASRWFSITVDPGVEHSVVTGIPPFEKSWRKWLWRNLWRNG